MKIYAHGNKLKKLKKNLANNNGNLSEEPLIPVEVNLYRKNPDGSVSEVNPYLDSNLKVIRINNNKQPIYLEPKGIKWMTTTRRTSPSSVKGSSQNPLITREYQDKVTEFSYLTPQDKTLERLLINRINGQQFIYVGNRVDNEGNQLKGFAPYQVVNYKDNSLLPVFDEETSNFSHLIDSYAETNSYGNYLLGFLNRVTQAYPNDKANYNLKDDFLTQGNPLYIRFYKVKSENDTNPRLLLSWYQGYPNLTNPGIKARMNRNSLKNEIAYPFIDCSKNIGDTGFITTIDELYSNNENTFELEICYNIRGGNNQNTRRNMTMCCVYSYKHNIPLELVDKKLGTSSMSNLPVFYVSDLMDYLNSKNIQPMFQTYFQQSVYNQSDRTTITDFTSPSNDIVLLRKTTIVTQNEGNLEQCGYVLDNSFDYTKDIILAVANNIMAASGQYYGSNYSQAIYNYLEGVLNLKSRLITNRATGENKLTFDLFYGKDKPALTFDGNMFIPNNRTSSYDTMRIVPADSVLFNFVSSIIRFKDDGKDKSVEIAQITDLVSEFTRYANPTIARTSKNQDLVYFIHPNQTNNDARTISANTCPNFAIIDGSNKNLLANSADIDKTNTDSLDSQQFKDIQLIKWLRGDGKPNTENTLDLYNDRLTTAKTDVRGEYLVDSRQLYIEYLLANAPVYLVVDKIFRVFGNPTYYKQALPLCCVFFRINDIYEYNTDNRGIKGFNTQLVTGNITTFTNLQLVHSLTNFSMIGIKVCDRVYEVEWDTKELTENEILANNFNGDKTMTQLSGYYHIHGLYPIASLGIYKLNLTLNTLGG